MVMEATKPASRILAMLELLQDRPGMSGPDLASALGVTTRTIRRYVATLQDMGIPVEPNAGRIGGYWLRPGYRMPPLMFSAEEAIGLALALLTTRVSNAHELPAPVASAIKKIVRSMPLELSQRVETIRDGFQMARNPWPETSSFPQPEVLAQLIQASLAHQRCWIRYGSWEGNQTSRDIDPYGVLFLDGRWYVHGWCHLRQDARTFRIDRVRRMDIMPQVFDPPPDIDIEDAVLRSIAMTRTGGEFELLIDAPLDRVRAYLPPPIAILEAVDEQRTRAYGTTDNPAWLASRIGGLPFDVTVVRLEALKTAMRTIGERMIAAASA
ncbi:MAG: YafY family transcriptional regulator [Chloroflexia bacterium]|nr:YafY family transcriptional regulator [Chloroflexia bacterium]